MNRAKPGGLCVCVLACAAISTASAGLLEVVSITPAPNSGNHPVGTTISVRFNLPIDRTTVTTRNFHVFGRWSGPAEGAISYSNSDQVVTLTPDRRFSAGEMVTLTLSKFLRAQDGSPFRSSGYQAQFGTRTRVSNRSFVELTRYSDRDESGAQTRIYGAQGSDVNNDGWLDLTVINEVSADIRVFLNRADGTGLYQPFLRPPAPIAFESSPNEPADFNFDGFVDVATASSAESVVSVLLGNGDGTFRPRQEIAVGGAPHGLALLDVDGDGDIDFATSNTSGDNISISLNNGNGVFGPATSFEGGGDDEYALGSADMNEDGIMDLVVGARGSQRIIIHRGNGNGTFTNIFQRLAGGSVWMLGTGDVNGDGHMDVHTGNAGSGNGSILLGTGTGALNAAQTYPIPAGAIATDLGDYDGDGDMDWVLSSFSGQVWRIFINNGSGVFTLGEEFEAPSNPACALAIDFDNDRDLDLVLLDEIADVAVLMKNDRTTPPGDTNCDGQVNFNDIDGFVLALVDAATYAAAYPTCYRILADANDDGVVNFDDISPFVGCVVDGSCD